MEYPPGLPQDTKSLRSCSGDRAKMLLKGQLRIKCHSQYIQTSDSFSTVPSMVNEDDWGCFVHDLETIIVFVYQMLLRWFGHVERMDEYHMARRVSIPEVSGGQGRGRPRLGWMHREKVALGNRGMMVEAVCQCAKDWKEWRALVRI